MRPFPLLRRPELLAAAFAASLALFALPSAAAVIGVAPEGGALGRAVTAAAAGDILKLKPGLHDGPVVIDRPLTIEGEAGAAVDGHGRGRTIEVTAPGVTIRHLLIKGSGMELDQMHAAVFLNETATGSVVEDNAIDGNRIHGVRFAIHYMYTNDSVVSGNFSAGNHAGYVIMYSSRLIIQNNVSDGDRDHALLFNYANGSDISGNAVRGEAWQSARLRKVRIRDGSAPGIESLTGSAPVASSSLS